MESLYERRRKHSLYWFNKSSDLRGAAAAVWLSMDGELAETVVDRANLGGGFNMGVAVAPVYGMLCGMSLELVFKAIAVQLGQTVNESTHDLLEHIKATGLAYTKEQKALLKIFSHAATWEGRYPAPKREAAMDEFKKLVNANLFDRAPISEGSKLSVMRPNGALGWDGFSELWGKACARYFETREAEQSGAGKPATRSESE
jgi:hypothetical protein